MRLMPVTTIAVVVMIMASTTIAKNRPVYQRGKLLDMAVEDVNRGIAVVGGIAAPVRGKIYLFQIQLDDLIYVVEYRAGALSYQPAWIVNDPIDVRLGKDNRMFLKRPDGKELETIVTKRVRSE